MGKTTVNGVLGALLLITAIGCPARTPIRGVETTGLDRKLTTFSFIEEGDLVTFIVNTRATRYRAADPYLPLEVAIANRGLRTITLTRESFVLVDEAGNRYHLAEPRDLIDQYEFLDLDRRLSELPGIVDQRFGAFTQYHSNFSPTRLASPLRSSVVKDRVTLPRFGFIIDFLYFPRPTSGVMDQRFELHMEAPELPDPVFVKFNVL